MLIINDDHLRRADVRSLDELWKPRQDLGNSNAQYPLQKEMVLLKLSDKKLYRGLGAFCVEHHKNGCCCHRLY